MTTLPQVSARRLWTDRIMRGTRAERVYREAKVFSIGGGAEEIMKDLAAKQLGW